MRKRNYSLTPDVLDRLDTWSANEQREGREGNKSALIESLLRGFFGMEDRPAMLVGGRPTVADEDVAAAIAETATLSDAALATGLSLSAVSRRAKKLGLRA